MQINGPSQIHGPQSINAPHNVRPTSPTPSAGQVGEADQLDISPQANLINQVKEAPEIRSDLVAQIRNEIAAGTYETDEKLDVALDRLLDEIS